MEKTEIKEIISELYPVRYERRSAIAPVLWICGATFTTALIWCSVNVYLSQETYYSKFVCIFAGIIAGISFLTAICTTIITLIKKPEHLHSEHYLIAMRKMDIQKDGGNIDDKDDGNIGESTNNSKRDGAEC